MSAFDPGRSLQSRAKIQVAVTDFVFFALAMAVAFYVRFGSVDGLPAATGFWMIAGFLILSQYVFGLYDIGARQGLFSLVSRQVVSVLLVFLGVILMNYLLAKGRSGVFGRGILPSSLAAVTIAMLIVRLLWQKSLQRAAARERWLFVADSETAPLLAPFAQGGTLSGEISILTNAPSNEGQGHWDSLPEMLQKSWTGVVLSHSPELMKQWGVKILDARMKGQPLLTLSGFYENLYRRIPVDSVSPEWLALSGGFSRFRAPATLRMKRLVDVVVALIGLVLTSPIMLLAWIAIRLESPGDGFYSQIRTGQDGEPFQILKFRSMRTDAEKSGAQWAQANDARITRVGNFIRKTRIDELPQFINILRGDMSLVGPRPERPEFNEMLREKIPFYELRHAVKPGVTGWAQIRYPYGASIDDSRNKLEYDLYYIKNFSLAFDLKIILQTIRIVLLAAGR